MDKVFYLFRHGETDYNKEQRWQGCSVDSELNSAGRAQAHELARRLKDSGLQIIYSSPLKRALETARIVASIRQIPVEIAADLREACLGEAEGMYRTDVAQKFADVFAAWYGDNLDVGFPGGETRRQIQERMFNVVDSLLDAPQQIIGISSHGSSLRHLLMKFGFEPRGMKNAALYRLRRESGRWKLEELNVNQY